MHRTKAIPLVVQGRRLVIKDAAIMLSAKAAKPEWPWVEVTPGEYLVSLKKTEGKVVGIQVIQSGETITQRGAALGRVNVDNGAVAICDYDVLLSLTKSHPAEYADWTSDDCEEAIWQNALGQIEFKGSRIVHAKTGVGDGAFPVFALVSGKRFVGLECDFVAEPKKAPALKPSRFTEMEIKIHGLRDVWGFCDDRMCGAPDLDILLFDVECEVESAMNDETFGRAPKVLFDRPIARQIKRFQGLKKIEVFDEINGHRVPITNQFQALLSTAPTGPGTTPRQLARFIYKVLNAVAAKNPV